MYVKMFNVVCSNVNLYKYDNSSFQTGTILIIFRMNGDFSGKSQNFPITVYFAPPLTGFPLKLTIDARTQKAIMMGLPGGQKVLSWFSRLDNAGVCQTELAVAFPLINVLQLLGQDQQCQSWIVLQFAKQSLLL